MFAIVLVTFILLTVVALCIWPALEDWKAADAAKASGKDGGPAGAAAVPRPETLEGALVRQLFDHEISARQYAHEMARLAERDADRHPLSVPPEDQPS